MSDTRNLEPTARRRKQARDEGRVAATPFLGAAISWVTTCVAALTLAGWAASRFAAGLENRSAELSQSLAAGSLIEIVRQCISDVCIWLIPGLLCVFLLTVISRLAQVGFLWVPNRIKPDFNRINPANRSQSVVSADSLVLFTRGLVLMAILLGVAGYGLWTDRATLASTVSEFGASPVTLVSTWGLRLGCGLLLFALLDYVYQRRRFENSLRMTTEEVRAEIKAVEGSSQLANERRQRLRHWAEQPSA